MSRLWHIYALIDPRTDAVRYVGASLRVDHRFQDHVYKSKRKKTRSERWINSLVECGLRPFLKLLESGTEPSNCAVAERQWIAKFKADGADLTNHTDGGDGQPGCTRSDDYKRTHRGWKMPVSAIIKRSITMTGRPRPESVRRKISESNKGKKLSEENRAKILLFSRSTANIERLKILADNRRGKHLSPEHVAAAAAALRNLPNRAEVSAKISAALKGRPKTAEHRANISLAKSPRPPFLVVPSGSAPPTEYILYKEIWKAQMWAKGKEWAI